MARELLIAGGMFVSLLPGAWAGSEWSGLGDVDGRYRGQVTIETVVVPDPPRSRSFDEYVYSKYLSGDEPGVPRLPKVEGELKAYLDAAVRTYTYSGRVTVNVRTHRDERSRHLAPQLAEQVSIRVVGKVELEEPTLLPTVSSSGLGWDDVPPLQRSVDYRMEVSRDVDSVFAKFGADPEDRGVRARGFPCFQFPGMDHFWTGGGANVKRGRKSASVSAKPEWRLPDLLPSSTALRWLGDLKLKFSDETEEWKDDDGPRDEVKELRIDYGARIPIGEGYVIRLRLSFDGQKVGELRKGED